MNIIHPDGSATECSCTGCTSGCTGCDGSCFSCEGSCYDGCKGCDGSCTSCKGCSGGCSGNCSGTCNGCSGSCQGTCKNSCSSSCTSCSGCSGCTGSCSGGCKVNCQGECDNSCTADNQAEIIAHLGDNIAVGNIIKAMDYVELKNAIENEYRRRGKAVPEGFPKQPIPGERVILEVSKKVLTDVYEFDRTTEHDWRETFKPWEIAAAPKWEPVIAYIKVLMASTTE